MESDYVAEKLGWLDDVITDGENKGLFPAGVEATILKELARRWKDENRIGLLENLSSSFGEDRVAAVLKAILTERCTKGWEEAGRKGDNSLETFVEKLWGPLPAMGFEFTSERNGNVLQFRVTRCPLADYAKKAGTEKWLYLLACGTDEPSVTGFNRKIKFDRTQTLMQGHPICDHRYTVLTRTDRSPS
jgi:predicted ArsR family transcriptional regulator